VLTRMIEIGEHDVDIVIAFLPDPSDAARHFVHPKFLRAPPAVAGRPAARGEGIQGGDRCGNRRSELHAARVGIAEALDLSPIQRAPGRQANPRERHRDIPQRRANRKTHRSKLSSHAAPPRSFVRVFEGRKHIASAFFSITLFC
jgi:hypothetical protein